MSEFTRDEVETAFRHYFRVGQVLEDWEAWSDLFTDDAAYWIPLAHGQQDPLNHGSLMYEDKRRKQAATPARKPTPTAVR